MATVVGHLIPRFSFLSLARSSALVLAVVRTAEAATILRGLGTPLLIHQPSYSMLNRWMEGRLVDVLGSEGVGCIAFSVLAQGLLRRPVPQRHPPRL